MELMYEDLNWKRNRQMIRRRVTKKDISKLPSGPKQRALTLLSRITVPGVKLNANLPLVRKGANLDFWNKRHDPAIFITIDELGDLIRIPVQELCTLATSNKERSVRDYILEQLRDNVRLWEDVSKMRSKELRLKLKRSAAETRRFSKLLKKLPKSRKKKLNGA